MKALRSSFLNSNPRGSSPSVSSSSSSSASSNNQQRSSSGKDRQSTVLPGNQPINRSSETIDIVIRALIDYRAQRVVELSFRRGELLQALGEHWESDGSGWFKATNPLTQARGFVPMKHFQVFSSRVSPPPLPKPNPISPKQASTPSQNFASLQSRTSSSKSSAFFSSVTRSSHVPSHPPQYPASNPAPRSSHARKPGSPKPQPLYGIVKHDFRAERVDELGAKRGEAIILIAHSCREWFVAKPIGRLGGPGLIPVSFVEVKDLSTGKALRDESIKELMKNRIIPSVDEWKRAAAKYRGNSIPLGKFENPSSTTVLASQKLIPRMMRGASKSHQNLRTSYSKEGLEVEPIPLPPQRRPQVSRSDYQIDPMPKLGRPNQPISVANPRESSKARETVDKLNLITGTVPPKTTPRELQGPEKFTVTSDPSNHSKNHSDDLQTNYSGSGEGGYATVEDLRERYGILSHASVESFHMEDSKYWFHLRSHFIRPSSSNPNGEEATVLVLYRVYEDFFDFHASLLESFPAEAGLESMDQPKIIPKLPEPKDHVDELVCAERVTGLTEYLRDLGRLPSYIRESEIFYEFLGPREGDVELQEESSPSSSRSSGSDDEIALADQAVSRSDPDSPEEWSTDRETGGSSDEAKLRRERKEIDKGSANEGSDSRRLTLERKKRSSKKLRLAHSSHNLGSKMIDDLSPSPTSAGSNGNEEGNDNGEIQHARAVKGNHQSNFSSSTSASFNISPPQIPVNEANSSSTDINGQSSQAVYRIKVFQKDSKDVTVIKVHREIQFLELLRKVEEKIKSTLASQEEEEELSTGSTSKSDNSLRKGKLFLKDYKNGNGWVEFSETDNDQFRRWLIEGQNRLGIMYEKEN